jgi:hypothetical protein
MRSRRAGAPSALPAEPRVGETGTVAWSGLARLPAPAPVPPKDAPALCIDVAHVIDVFGARLQAEADHLVAQRLRQGLHQDEAGRAAREAAELTRRAAALGHAVDVVVDDLGRLYEVALRAAETVKLLSAAHPGPGGEATALRRPTSPPPGGPPGPDSTRSARR